MKEPELLETAENHHLVLATPMKIPKSQTLVELCGTCLVVGGAHPAMAVEVHGTVRVKPDAGDRYRTSELHWGTTKMPRASWILLPRNRCFLCHLSPGLCRPDVHLRLHLDLEGVEAQVLFLICPAGQLTRSLKASEASDKSSVCDELVAGRKQVSAAVAGAWLEEENPKALCTV